MINAPCPSLHVPEEEAQKPQINPELANKYHLNRIHSIFRSYCLAAVGGPIVAAGLCNPFSVSLAAVVGSGLFVRNLYLYAANIGFEVSILYVMVRAINWWDPITKNITLGGLPIINEAGNINDVQKLKEFGATAVLCLNHTYELQRGFTIPATEEDWVKEGITYKQIPCADFCGLTREQILKAVAFMHEQISKGNNVYVHCKAGHGRSVMAVVFYLYLYGADGLVFDSIQETYDYVKKLRPRVNLNAKQFAALESYTKRARLLTPEDLETWFSIPDSATLDDSDDLSKEDTDFDESPLSTQEKIRELVAFLSTIIPNEAEALA